MTHTLNNFWLNLSKLFASISFKKTKTELRSKRIYRETYKSLSELTDKDLLDIGITRGDIHDIAYAASYGVERNQNPNLNGWA
jgi:uncharacterized protein YjiS (DUF1127 family)